MQGTVEELLFLSSISVFRMQHYYQFLSSPPGVSYEVLNMKLLLYFFVVILEFLLSRSLLQVAFAGIVVSLMKCSLYS
jgi:hypothetical protein